MALTRIQLRRGTAAEWTAANPVLASGEPGFVKNTQLFKIGDGVTPWNALEYFAQGAPGGSDAATADWIRDGAQTGDAFDERGNARYFRSGVAVIGDMGNSLASNGTLSFYDRALSGAISLGAVSYFGWALPKTRMKFQMGGVAATNGFNTDQIIATHLPSVLASNWGYVHLQISTNDFGAGFSMAKMKANYVTIVEAILGAGKTPIAATMPPVNTMNTGAGLTSLTQMNLWIKGYAKQMNLPIVDYWSATVDAATNLWATGLSGDGMHPLNLGAIAMGDELARALNSIPNRRPADLAPSYNPNLMVPDVGANSLGADKITTAGGTGGGWSLRSTTGPWKGNLMSFSRGSAGYTVFYPSTGAVWVPGHRIRVSFLLDVSKLPASGTWSAYLYNVTQFQQICGFRGMSGAAMTEKSLTITDGAVTSASNQVTSPGKQFRPEHVGCIIGSSVGVSYGIPQGTTIIGVSADGGTAYMSANATATQAVATVNLYGTPLSAVFEFTVQPDMVGDDIRFAATVDGAAGATIAVGQITVTDLTAMGIPA